MNLTMNTAGSQTLIRTYFVNGSYFLLYECHEQIALTKGHNYLSVITNLNQVWASYCQAVVS